MQTISEVRLELPHDEMQIKFRPDESIVFASSSGHCNLDCSYCVASPVVKLQPSLSYEDLMFMAQRIGGKVFFIFSGRGDFFAGYRKSDRLLQRLLEHEHIAVALDVNGVVIHCFPELSDEQLKRVRHVNLTFHYQQLKSHKALQVWRDNALRMLHRHDNPDFFVNFILSPGEAPIWREALQWYQTEVHAHYPKALILINDVLAGFSAEQEALLQALTQDFAPILHSVRRGNFESVLKSFDHVSCAAGRTYFRVWNNGDIDACPNVSELRLIGNAKSRQFALRADDFACADVRHCDCYHIASAGRMTFYKRSASDPGPPHPSRTIAIHPAR